MLRLLETGHDNSSSELAQLLAGLSRFVEAIYNRFLCSIGMDRRSLVRKMLLIIVGSRRPLQSEEMRLLLAIQPHHKTTEEVKPACQSRA